jgi:hypothetical protein
LNVNQLLCTGCCGCGGGAGGSGCAHIVLLA